ncbi:hypothetical protein UUU_27820 [Klebsiella pneumoniae subsp. pneumoniae DSM 30104 = JCM 1662 = NBRC 14940]|nr:hypothetical protein UUU_27820 [Klebsiella pneumoniae subsp. pneumoniae DSM 30104 = JCM 1662 = NBRC 14940]
MVHDPPGILRKSLFFGKIKMTAIVHETDIVCQLFVFPNPIMRS